MTLPHFQIRLRNRRPSNEELVDDLRQVFRSCRHRPISADTYASRGQFGVNTYVARFGSWNAGLAAAGLPINVVRKATHDELFENLAEVWRKLGHQPIGRDIIRRGGVSRYSLGAYESRFGTWNKALLAFGKFINQRRKAPPPKKKKQALPQRDRLPRKINWRLRATVLIRDNCLCRMCGASPAKDPAVTLHVDHIVPWSKGGATILSNLQTLCAACNIGKADQTSPRRHRGRTQTRNIRGRRR
jgi:HNH endonuclease/Homing endonuclease associated repeat